MKRNAFVIQQNGRVHHFEPSFTRTCLDTPVVHLGIVSETKNSGLVLITGQTVTTDALLSLRAIISDQLADMARNELEELA